jgi:hypothetical protein
MSTPFSKKLFLFFSEKVLTSRQTCDILNSEKGKENPLNQKGKDDDED